MVSTLISCQVFLFLLLVKVHTHLTDYNHLMRSKYEYVAGPVPEVEVVGGKAVFEKPVEIIIPHCLNLSKTSAVRVLSGTGKDFQVTEMVLCISKTWENDIRADIIFL